MKPKKFFYKEINYGGYTYLIELVKGKLKLQRTYVGETIISEFDIFVELKIEEWKMFFNFVKSLNSKPKKPKYDVLDGFEVKCNIKFDETLIKFNIINPENFENFRSLVNSITICHEYPNGLLENDDQE